MTNGAMVLHVGVGRAHQHKQWQGRLQLQEVKYFIILSNFQDIRPKQGAADEKE